MPPTIILASASPRRHEFLRRLGIAFETVVADIDETPYVDEEPEALACRLAAAKATAASVKAKTRNREALFVASDTVVAFEGHILGKPANADDAARMLRLLRGNTHQVHTAITVLAAATGEQTTRLNTTTVLMRDYDDDEIAAYIATGDPMDKAGAYAIQHPIFAPVAALDGCFSGVMGLPLGDLRDLLTERSVVVEASLPAICERHTQFPCCQRSVDLIMCTDV